jgi:hypothetical protein
LGLPEDFTDQANGAPAGFGLEQVIQLAHGSARPLE